jgi:hypothetical protein
VAVSSGSTGQPTFWPRSVTHELDVALRFERRVASSPDGACGIRGIRGFDDPAFREASCGLRLRLRYNVTPWAQQPLVHSSGDGWMALDQVAHGVGVEQVALYSRHPLNGSRLLPISLEARVKNGRIIRRQLFANSPTDGFCPPGAYACNT